MISLFPSRPGIRTRARSVGLSRGRQLGFAQQQMGPMLLRDTTKRVRLLRWLTVAHSHCVLLLPTSPGGTADMHGFAAAFITDSYRDRCWLAMLHPPSSPGALLPRRACFHVRVLSALWHNVLSVAFEGKRISCESKRLAICGSEIFTGLSEKDNDTWALEVKR